MRSFYECTNNTLPQEIRDFGSVTIGNTPNKSTIHKLAKNRLKLEVVSLNTVLRTLLLGEFTSESIILIQI
jgi:hypothetical protein